MIRLTTAVTLLATVCLLSLSATAEDWRVWRGPNANGIAPSGQNIPTTWSDTENVIWKVKVPGRGHCSPIVIGDFILMSTADDVKQTQSVVCFSRTDGKLLWSTQINQGGFDKKIHQKNTYATPSVSSNGKLVFATFYNHNQIQLAALDLKGKVVWKKYAGGFVPIKYQFGYAPSALLYNNSVIVSSEYEADGFLAAFDQATGKELWRTKRPKQISYSTPIVGKVAGKEQLLLSGCKMISSFDPNTGKQNWTTEGIWEVTCATMIWNDKLVFASGGYPKKGTMAVKADGSGQVVWENQIKSYEQSMLIKDGYLYVIADTGVAYCWRASDGQEMWKARLGGMFSSSPTLVGNRVYAFNEKGTGYVFEASPKAFNLIATNQLGNDTFATPAICNNQMILRVGTYENGTRQEYLYLIGNK